MIYHVPITRSESVTREFSVLADTPGEAVEKALQKAYEYEWPRGADAQHDHDEPQPQPPPNA